jgi:TM2 domain-containing membrane protein YozV
LLVHAPKRRTTVLLLCLFLGWAGCHRFYVGKRRSGRIYLLTSGLLFLGVFVDLVLILAGSFEDRFGQPLI